MYPVTIQLLIYSMTLFNHINNKIVEIPSTLPEETLLVTTLQCSNVEIKCDFQEEDYNGIIYWIIGGLIYDPNNNFYPSTSFNNSDTLLVLNADSNYHNTTFQCFYLTPSDQVLGTEIRLVVLESNSYTCEMSTNSKNLLSNVRKIQEIFFEIDIQTVIINVTYTIFEVFYPDICRNISSIFFLELNEISNSSLNRRISLTCCEAMINSTQILSNDNRILQLRLNDSTCGIHSRIISTFQDFDTKRHYINGNKFVCLDFPQSTSLCRFSTRNFLFFAISTNCIIPVNSDLLDNFACYLDFDSFTINYNRTSQSTCLSNFKKNFSRTVVFFLCFGDNQIIRHYAQSHEIIFENSDVNPDNFTNVFSTATTIATTTSTISSTTSLLPSVQPLAVYIVVLIALFVTILTTIPVMLLTGVTLYCKKRRRANDTELVNPTNFKQD